jgi:hypothetical protein
VARIADACRAEVRERVLALGDSDLDVDGEEFADRMAVDTVMCAFGIGKGEATTLVNLADRLTVLPAVWDAWQAGVLDGSRVRVLVRATEVLDDATGVLQLHADAADIALADQVVTDLAHAWPATDDAGVRLSMDQRRADALIGLFRAFRDGSLTDQPGLIAGATGDPDAGSAFDSGAASAGSASPAGFAPGTVLLRVPVRRVHDLGLVVHADTLFGDGPAADEPAQLRGLGRSCDLDHDTPWPRGPTSVTNLDPKCRRHHNAKTLGVFHATLTAGPGTGPRTVHWTLPAGVQVTTTREPLPGVRPATRLAPTPTAS